MNQPDAPKGNWFLRWLRKPRPTRGYIEQSVGLFVLALIFLLVHFIALGQLDVDESHTSVASVLAYIPREIGIAALIAGVLNLIVERNTQQRHREMEALVVARLREESDREKAEIQKDVLTAVFRQNLGKHAVAQVRDRLFQPTLYRKSVKVVYSLKQNEASGRKFVVISGCVTATISNASRTSLKYRVQFETTSPRAFAEYSKVDSVKINGKETLKPAQVRVQGGVVSYVDDAEYAIAPKEELITSVMFQRAEHVSGCEVHCCRLPTEYCEVVVFGEGNLNLFATALHLDEMEEQGRLENARTWSLKGLLPGQGLCINWSLEPTS